jgi:hypothetical protein
LATPVTGWHVGDMIVIPDTRQTPAGSQGGPGDISEKETVQIAGISANGTVITLAAPLTYDHLGARDVNGNLTFLPHVAELSHNVVIHSENPAGVRGHVLFTYRANVQIQNAAFVDTGRTTDAVPDNTTFDTAGNVTHLGTNEGGRYAVQFLHLMGPATPAPGSPQYVFAGNAVY